MQKLKILDSKGYGVTDPSLIINLELQQSVHFKTGSFSDPDSDDFSEEDEDLD